MAPAVTLKNKKMAKSSHFSPGGVLEFYTHPDYFKNRLFCLFNRHFYITYVIEKHLSIRSTV